MLGTGTVTSGYAPGFLYSHPYYAFYAQDDYHITSKLTLTYGLRYNLELPDKENKNQYVFLDLVSPSPLNSQVGSLGNLTGGPGFVGTNGVGSRLQTTQKLNFDPEQALHIAGTSRQSYVEGLASSMLPRPILQTRAQASRPLPRRTRHSPMASLRSSTRPTLFPTDSRNLPAVR